MPLSEIACKFWQIDKYLQRHNKDISHAALVTQNNRQMVNECRNRETYETSKKPSKDYYTFTTGIAGNYTISAYNNSSKMQ